MARAYRLESAGTAAALALAALIVAPSPAAADIGATRDKLEQVEAAAAASHEQERRLADRAAGLTAELDALRQKLVRAAAAAQAQEEKLTALELRLAELNAEAFLRRDMLSMRRDELAGILGALCRLARQPAIAVVAAPRNPIDMLRSARLLASVTPALRAEAKALKAELDGLAALRQTIVDERRRIGDAKARLDSEQETIRRLVAVAAEKREDLAAERHETQQQIVDLAAEAKTLQALLHDLEQAEAERREAARLAAEAKRLAEARRREEAARQAAANDQPLIVASIGVPPLPFSASRGHLAMPARGRLIHRFGDPNGLGQTSKGITIATRADAQVIAPHDGRVVFAGEFRDYGQLLIVDPGEGYHILLAGMSQLYAVVGQSILAGEPVGEMGSGPDGNPALYVELRRKGKAINPLPWLAAGNREVSG